MAPKELDIRNVPKELQRFFAIVEKCHTAYPDGESRMVLQQLADDATQIQELRKFGEDWTCVACLS